MAKKTQSPYPQIANSIYTSSRNYDPIASADILRIRIADGVAIVDNRREWFGTFYVAQEAVGNREFWDAKSVPREVAA